MLYTHVKPRAKVASNCATASKNWSAWEKEKSAEDDSSKEKSDDNLIGLRGFPLYSDKYNPNHKEMRSNNR